MFVLQTLPHIEKIQKLHIKLNTEPAITHTDVDAGGGGDGKRNGAQAPRKCLMYADILLITFQFTVQPATVNLMFTTISLYTTLLYQFAVLVMMENLQHVNVSALCAHIVAIVAIYRLTKI